MTESERVLIEELERTGAQLSQLRESLESLAAELREINRDLAAFATRKKRFRSEGPVA